MHPFLGQRGAWAALVLRGVGRRGTGGLQGWRAESVDISPRMYTRWDEAREVVEQGVKTSTGSGGCVR